MEQGGGTVFQNDFKCKLVFAFTNRSTFGISGSIFTALCLSRRFGRSYGRRFFRDFRGFLSRGFFRRAAFGYSRGGSRRSGGIVAAASGKGYSDCRRQYKCENNVDQFVLFQREKALLYEKISDERETCQNVI